MNEMITDITNAADPCSAAELVSVQPPHTGQVFIVLERKRSKNGYYDKPLKLRFKSWSAAELYATARKAKAPRWKDYLVVEGYVHR